MEWLVVVVAVLVALVAVLVMRRRPSRPVVPAPLPRTDPHVGGVLPTDGQRQVQVEAVLGQGGMAKVYRGVMDGLPVAVKVMRPQQDLGDDARRRFRRELDVCRALQHPAVVKVFDWHLPGPGPEGVSLSTLRDEPFMVMELVKGQTLSQILESRGGPLPPDEVARWLRAALEALKEAHAAGIIHRDIKPENLMVTGSGTLRIMDFGLARVLSAEALTKSNTIVGTPQYMSPEHLEARSVVPASDIYSLGVTAYELLTGRPPVEGPDPGTTIMKMLTETIPHVTQVNPAVPQALGDVVMRMMARDLADRLATCDDVLALLG